jgi:hypothetical protein
MQLLLDLPVICGPEEVVSSQCKPLFETQFLLLSILFCVGHIMMWQWCMALLFSASCFLESGCADGTRVSRAFCPPSAAPAGVMGNVLTCVPYDGLSR